MTQWRTHSKGARIFSLVFSVSSDQVVFECKQLEKDHICNSLTVTDYFRPLNIIIVK